MTPPRRRLALKEQLQRGDGVVGAFVTLPDPGIAEVMGIAGFDFLILDLEHGSYGSDTVSNFVRACHAAETAPLARVGSAARTVVLAALETGVDGLVVPHVTSPSMAAEAVEVARFAPQGRRSLNGAARAARYSDLDPLVQIASANEQLVMMALIEELEGIDDAVAISEVDGIDAVVVGPNDLSSSLGVAGRADDPLVTDTIGRFFESLDGYGGASPGVFAVDRASAEAWIARGAQVLVYSCDVAILMEGCKSAYEDIASALKRVKV